MIKASIKKPYMICCILVAAVFLTVALLLLSGWKKQAAGFLVVDSAPVSEEEFLLYVSEAKASAAAFYYQQYGMDSNQSGFWSTPAEEQRFPEDENSSEEQSSSEDEAPSEGRSTEEDWKPADGRTPAEYLLDEVLPQIAEAKVQQAEMERYGIIESADYNTFLKTYDDTMSQRKQDAASGRVLYGPVEMQLQEFYSYYYGLRQKEFQEYFKTNLLECTEEELRTYYEELKTTTLRPEITAAVTFYEYLSDAQADPDSGEEFILDSRYAGKEEEDKQRLLAWIEESEEGSTTGPVDYNDRSGYLVLTQKEQQPFPEFEVVKDNLFWMYGDVACEKYLAEKCSRAEIMIDRAEALRLIEEYITAQPSAEQ